MGRSEVSWNNCHPNEQSKGLAVGIPSDWNEAKRRQKDLDATHTKKHGKGYHGDKLSISVDVKHKFIRKITTGTASEHDSNGFFSSQHTAPRAADCRALSINGVLAMFLVDTGASLVSATEELVPARLTGLTIYLIASSALWVSARATFYQNFQGWAAASCAKRASRLAAWGVACPRCCKASESTPVRCSDGAKHCTKSRMTASLNSG